MEDSTRLVAAVAAAWRAIQKVHPQVPDVIITVGAGSVRGGLILGHFAPGRWSRGDDRVHELFVGGEGLERGADEVMATLLHEAAHGVAVAADVQDVSRNGRYHNKRFKEIAEAMGLELSFDATLGWSTSAITPSARTLYRSAITRLRAAITAFRIREIDHAADGNAAPGGGHGKGRGRPSNNNGVALICGCIEPRRIRVAPSIAELGPIECGICGNLFHAA